MIPFAVLGWFLYGLWLVFYVFLVVFLFFHGSSHDFWLVFIVLHSSRMVFHGCWLVFMFSHGFRLAFQVFYWDLFMKDQLLVQKLHIWPNSYRKWGDHSKRWERIKLSRFQSVTKNDHFLELHPNQILDFLRQIILENESTIQESVHHIVN